MDDIRSAPVAVYLDGHATTPLAPEAASAMAPWWSSLVANAHSPHHGGQRAAAAVEVARRHVADLIGATPSEVIFTSGATESNALAILGLAEAARRLGDKRRRIVVSAIEHKSVLACAEKLGTDGFEVIKTPVGADGVVDLAAFASAVDDRTLLVSVMAANNEVGTLQPIDAIAEIVRRTDAVLHCDAAQLVGKLPFQAATCDMVSLSSHKMYGPVGIGGLFISSATPLRPRPIFAGGDQEGGLRPGTLPTPLIVGFGEAALLAATRQEQDAAHGERLSVRLVAALRARKVDLSLNAPDAPKIPGSLSIRFEGCDASSLISRLGDDVYIADGSACTSGQIGPSHVLTAMAISKENSESTARLFVGRYTTETEIDDAAEAIARAVRAERGSHWTDHPVVLLHERHAARF